MDATKPATSYHADVIQTLRTAHQNQTQLNLMADQKANILIGALVVVFSVVLSRVGAVLDLHDRLNLPVLAFVLLQLVPLVLATLVLIPRNVRLKKRRNQSMAEVSNPLFFGHYSVFAQDEYIEHMMQRLEDNAAARILLLTDLYQMGQILKRKYRLLRRAYVAAAIGVVVPVLLLVAVLWG